MKSLEEEVCEKPEGEGDEYNDRKVGESESAGIGCEIQVCRAGADRGQGQRGKEDGGLSYLRFERLLLEPLAGGYREVTQRAGLRLDAVGKTKQGRPAGRPCSDYTFRLAKLIRLVDIAGSILKTVGSD